MASTKKNATYSSTPREYPVIISITGAESCSVLEDKPLKIEDIQKTWIYQDVIRYLVSLKSRDKALIAIKRMSGVWIQMSILGMTKDVVYDNNGNVAWNNSDGDQGMYDYLTKKITQFYDGIRHVEEAKREMDVLDGKPVVTEYDKDYHALVNEATAHCKEVLDQYKLRENIPTLKLLTDIAYDRFCLKFVSSNTPLAVAMAYSIGMQNCVDMGIIHTKKLLYETICDAIGKSTSTAIKAEWLTFDNPRKQAENKNNAWKYVDEASKFIDSLK